MRRKLGVIVAAVALVAVAGPVAAPAAAASRPRCVDRPGLVAATSQAVVFRVTVRRETSRLSAGWYACDVRSRRVTSLGEYDPDCCNTSFVDVAGRYVGWYDRRCSSGGCAAGADILNVRTGRRRPFDSPTGDHALGLQVTAAGSIAWVRQVLTPAPQCCETVQRYEVVRAEPGGAQTVLEEGQLDQFAPGSLAAAGGRVYWFAQGRAASATLR